MTEYDDIAAADRLDAAWDTHVRARSAGERAIQPPPDPSVARFLAWIERQDNAPEPSDAFLARSRDRLTVDRISPSSSRAARSPRVNRFLFGFDASPAAVLAAVAAALLLALFSGVDWSTPEPATPTANAASPGPTPASDIEVIASPTSGLAGQRAWSVGWRAAARNQSPPVTAKATLEEEANPADLTTARRERSRGSRPWWIVASGPGNGMSVARRPVQR